MPSSLVLAPTPDPRVFLAPDGTRCSPPAGWACLPPGDAGLTRRVKQAGPSWAVIEKGARREVRQELAEVSRAVLDLHRRDAPHTPVACPLCAVVTGGG